MKYLLMLFLPLSLISAPIQDFENKNAFFYTNLGGYYASQDIKGVDFGLGYRHIYGFSAFDVNVGGTLIDPIVPFAQGSYLMYPLEWNGPYLGAGISIVPLNLMDDLPVLVNFPLIAGYQIPGKTHPIFIQFQYSVFTLSGGTLSLGFGF